MRKKGEDGKLEGRAQRVRRGEYGKHFQQAISTYLSRTSHFSRALFEEILVDPYQKPQTYYICI